MLYLLMQAHGTRHDFILKINLILSLYVIFMHKYRDSTIPEEKQPSAEGGMSKSIPKREQQYIMVKTSPKSRSRNNNGSQQTRGLLAHSSDSDDASDNDAKGKLMKSQQQQQQQKKTKKNFSVGSDDDDDYDETSRMKRS